jgi:hypothetical protein
MAITIISNLTSNKWYPSSNPINITVDSNNSGKCNFRYICDLYINGVKIFMDKLFPDPTTGYGFFQLSRVIQDYIQTTITKQSDYLTNSSLIKAASSLSAPSSQFSIQVKFGEEYDNSVNCDGTVLQYLNLQNSNTAFVFETAIDYEDFPTFNGNSYLMGTQSATTPFLTNSNKEIEVTYNDPYSVDFITTNQMNSSWNVLVSRYANGSIISTQSIPYVGVSTIKRWRLWCGPLDINSTIADVFISPAVDEYRVQLRYINTVVSETLTFKVKDPKPFRTRIGFTGLKGGVENFTFYHRNRKSFNIVRKDYNKTLQSNYSNQLKYEVGDRGDTTYAVSAKEVHNVASFCDKKTSEWLYEMWLSPNVFTWKRQDLLEFRTYVDGSDLKLWVEGDLLAGDTIYVFDNGGNLNGRTEVVSVSGNSVLTDAGWSTSLSGCGWVLKESEWQILPIIISDNSIEVKQKLSRPIEYSLNYAMAYEKTTLRG